MIVDAPWPQPTSATRPPASSLSSTPSSAGIHESTRLRVVAGAEEALGALEEVVVVLVPADALAGAERLADLRLVAHGDVHELERAAEEGRARLVGQRERLLRRERVGAASPGRR